MTPSLHAAPHAPQFFGSLDVFVSQPSDGSALQSARSGSHASWHLPSVQTYVPCVEKPGFGHAVSHAPQ